MTFLKLSKDKINEKILREMMKSASDEYYQPTHKLWRLNSYDVVGKSCYFAGDVWDNFLAMSWSY